MKKIISGVFMVAGLYNLMSVLFGEHENVTDFIVNITGAVIGIAMIICLIYLLYHVEKLEDKIEQFELLQQNKTKSGRAE